MQYFWSVLDILPRTPFSLRLEDVTQVGLVILGLGILFLFLLAYAVAKISTISIYLIDHIFRYLWIAVKTLLPSMLVVLVYHVIIHVKTRTPEEAVGLARSWYDMLWKS